MQIAYIASLYNDAKNEAMINDMTPITKQTRVVSYIMLLNRLIFFIRA